MAEAEQHRDIEHRGNVSELRAVAQVRSTREQVAAVTYFLAEPCKNSNDSQIAQGELPVESGYP